MINNNLQVKDILNFINGELLYGNVEIECESFSKDTRNIKKGDIYLGIKGESFNGSEFYIDALEKGAKGCIIQDVDVDINIYKRFPDRFIIKVVDVILALQDIARHKRNLYDIPVVAVTGSVGKTSTRDLIASVVAEKYKVLKTQGNYNNNIGLPLTILEAKDQEAMVLEMGMNQKGEISLLTKIAKPTIAVITNVGTAHIGNLGSRENILKAKLEIMEGLSKEGTLIINNDNDMLNKWNIENKEKNLKLVTFGADKESDVKANNIKLGQNGSTYEIDLGGQKQVFKVPVGGKHFVVNSLAAVAVGKVLGIEIDKIKKGIEEFELTKRRMDISILKNNVMLINDSYNASYDSMKASIEYLASLKSKRKIAILGDMLELGEYAEDLHRKVGNEILKNNIDILITVGEYSNYIVDQIEKNNENNVKIYKAKNIEEASEIAKKIIREEDAILVKASNSMRFNVIVENIKETFVEKDN